MLHAYGTDGSNYFLSKVPSAKTNTAARRGYGVVMHITRYAHHHILLNTCMHPRVASLKY
jgi:hypothetical protein